MVCTMFIAHTISTFQPLFKMCAARRLQCYGLQVTSSVFIGRDDDAWNLAYLSWDFEKSLVWSDPHFSVNVHRTLQFVIDTAELDIVGLIPDHKKVRGLLASCPPAQAVLRLSQMKLIRQTPLYLAYGDKWLRTINERARLYREPYDEILDAKIDFFDQAKLLLSAYLPAEKPISMKAVERPKKICEKTFCSECNIELNAKNLARHLNNVHSLVIKNGKLVSAKPPQERPVAGLLCTCGARVLFSNLEQHQKNGHSLDPDLIEGFVVVTPDKSSKSKSIRTFSGGLPGLGKK